jgi:hypothetical protein
MENNSRSLLLFLHHSLSDEELNLILSITESPEQFCTAYELVDRNRITSNYKKIWKESRRNEMRAFRFLINKN